MKNVVLGILTKLQDSDVSFKDLKIEKTLKNSVNGTKRFHEIETRTDGKEREGATKKLEEGAPAPSSSGPFPFSARFKKAFRTIHGRTLTSGQN